MAYFGKKNESATDAVDSADFVRIPQGTRLGAGADGKLKMSFAGDMSFGEELPELSELECGRNLSIDPGVTIRAGIIRVKGLLELEEGAELHTQELEAEKIVSRKGTIKARTISAGQLEAEGSSLVAERVTARESVLLDRGDMEIGTVMAQTLTVTKGTLANILIAEVAKLDGSIPKGGYENFDEFLSKVALYHPEVLNDQFSAQARKAAGNAATAEARPAATSEAPKQESPQVAADKAKAKPPSGEAASPTLPERLPLFAERIKAFYQGKESPGELSNLVGHLLAKRLDDVRRELTPTYQKLSSQGKMPPPVMEIFREIQEAVRDGGKS